jgi:hypothetical protein
MAILPERSIKVVVGDLNGRLARAYDFTGKKRVLKEHDNVETEVSGCWSVHRNDNEMGGKIRDFLIEESMVAASTYFHPQRKVGGAKTYEPFGDAGKGRKGAGLDYACIYERYQSSCTSVEIKWGPSEHRFGSGNGVQKDHAMLVMNLRLRVAKRKVKVRQNVAALKTEAGAELARAAYVAERAAVQTGTFVEKEDVSRMAQSFWTDWMQLDAKMNQRAKNPPLHSARQLRYNRSRCLTL